MKEVEALFEKWAGESALSVEALAANGSNRQYFRVVGQHHRCIAAVNPDIRENDAFIYYSRFFHEAGVSVPELFAVSDSHKVYLQQDLGDQTLYALLQDKKQSGSPFDDEAVALYHRVLADLAKMQVAGRGADFSYSYPRMAFDRQSIQWDLNYFKYYFLKPSGVPFDEQLLEDDFQALIALLLDTDCNYFLYRDFQARNIMMVGEEPYYIDYQGGRRGAAQYDVASLLYSAKSELPNPLREELLEVYISELSKHVEVDKADFRSHYYTYVLVRILQTMGAYGYRGWFERKEYFLQSIPLAKANLKKLIADHPQPKTAYLMTILENLVK